MHGVSVFYDIDRIRFGCPLFLLFQIDDVTMDMEFVIGRSMAEELPFIPGYDYKKMLEPDFSVEEYMEEHKKYKHIHISEYKKRFNKQMKQYEKDFERTHCMAS